MINYNNENGTRGFFDKNQGITNLSSYGFSEGINVEDSYQSKVNILDLSLKSEGIEKKLLTLAVRNSLRSITIYDFHTLERLFIMESKGEEPILVEDFLSCDYKHLHSSVEGMEVVEIKLLQNYFDLETQEKTKN